MLRLASSAVNKQPWRVVKDEDTYHFYKSGDAGNDSSKIDLKRVDMGIAACHFHLAVLEKGLPGRFHKLAWPEIKAPGHLEYVFSWTAG